MGDFSGCLSCSGKDATTFMGLWVFTLGLRLICSLWNALQRLEYHRSIFIVKSYWKCVFSAFYLLVRCFHLGCLKRRPSKYQGVAYDSSGPHINFVRMASYTLYYLGRDVVWRPTHGSFLFLHKLQLGSKPKISNFNIHILIHEDIPHLEITMNDSIFVHVLDCWQKLQY